MTVAPLRFPGFRVDRASEIAGFRSFYRSPSQLGVFLPPSAAGADGICFPHAGRVRLRRRRVEHAARRLRAAAPTADTLEEAVARALAR